MDVGRVSVIGDSVPSARESAFVGLRSTAAGVGGVLGPMIVGLMVTVVGFETAFATASVFAFAAAFLIIHKLEEPTYTTPPTTTLQTVETTLGLVQLPGAHRGKKSDE